MMLGILLALSVVASGIGSETLIRNMELAFQNIEAYRTDVEVTKPAPEGRRQEERFTYSFKKPNRIRIEYEQPQQGTLLVYPDPNGKVHVRPWGWRFLDMRLDPDSMLLGDPSGQRVDQTDLGLLIKNISESMTGERRGPLQIAEDADTVTVTVPAEDHFREGKVTLYTFVVDKGSWLPREVHEHTLEGSWKRSIRFRNMRINPGIGDDIFGLNGD